MTKKVGLALGGGGVRGLAHIGVLKVLERENIPIDLIAGTSAGGLIGGAYAHGMSVEEIEGEIEEMRSPLKLAKLMDSGVFQTKNGLLSGEQIVSYFTELLGEGLTFDDMKIPFAAVAISLEDGKEVVLSSGELISAMRASMSVPGFFEPCERDDLRLIDGGILNNVPADVVREMGADVVIAVDVTFPIDMESSSLLDIGMGEELWQTIVIMLNNITERRLKESAPEVLIRPTLPPDVSMFAGFGKADEIIAAGVGAAEAALADIQSALSTS